MGDQHAAVLEHASVLVTHGGLGSVMAGLNWATPIILVPATPLVDIHDRVVELDLGRRVEVADPGIRRAVTAMRDHVRRAGGAVRAANEIGTYLTRMRIDPRVVID